MDINNFLNYKSTQKIKYFISKDIDKHECFKKFKQYKHKKIHTEYKDLIIAVDDEQIVGFALLLYGEQCAENFNDVLILTNIEVDPEYRNKGIATNIIDITLKYIQDNNKILMRTRPEEDGLSYIFEKINNKIKTNNIPCVAHNLKVVYEYLELDVFPNKKFSIEEKINIFNSVCEDMIKNPKLNSIGVTDIENIDFFHGDFVNNSIKNLSLNKIKTKSKIKY